MTTSVLNHRRAKKLRAIKKAERRSERRREGDWKRYGSGPHPNRTRNNWGQSKERR